MEESTNFSMKNSLTLFSLANKFPNSSRDEIDDYIYTYTSPFMKNFVKQSIKEADLMHLINIKNLKLHQVFKIVSKKLDVNGNIRETLEKYFEFLNKYEGLYTKKI